MKNKAFFIVVISALILVSSLFLVSCKAGKKEDVVGTYKLVTDTRTEYQQETVDNIEKYGREAYLVVTGKDYGYYVYKDNSTPVFAREVKLEYFYNDEGKVSSISFLTGEGDKTKSFNVDARERIALISRWPSASKLIDAYDIQYDKADKATDLSYIKKVYDDLPIFGYDLYDYNALFYAEITNGLQENYSKYIYKYYNIDSSKCKATLYYALRSDEKPVVVTDLNVTFERDEETNKPVAISIGDDKYNIIYTVPTRPVKVTVDGEELDVNEELYYSNLNPSDYDSYFQGLIDEYKKTLQESDNSTTKG